MPDTAIQPSTPTKHGKSHRAEWTTPKRVEVLTLRRQGLSQEAIAEQTGVPRKTISNWIRKADAGGPKSRRTGAVRPGRPKRLDKHDVRRLIAKATEDYEGRKLSWARLGRDCGLDVSPKTIKRALNKAGFHRCKACKKPFLSKANVKARRCYAEEHLHEPVEYWQQHMYSDEASFSTAERGSVWVTRRTGERFHKDCIQHTFDSGRASIMVWGAISYNWKSELLIIESTYKPTKKFTKEGEPEMKKSITSKDYKEQVLEVVVGPAFRGETEYEGYKYGGQFVEDAAPIHGSRKVLVQVKKDLGIPLHNRPSASPDFNPIENIWRIMKSRIKARRKFPGTLKEMRQAVLEEWDKITLEEINKAINSMPERLKEARAKKGLMTSY